MAGSLSLRDEPVQPRGVRRREPGRALAEHAALAQDRGRGPEVARVEEDWGRALEDAEDLVADRLRSPWSSNRSNRTLSAAPRTSRRYSSSTRRGHRVDLALVEEVERRVEVLEVDDALGPRRRLLGGLRRAGRLAASASAAAGGVGARLLRQRAAALAEELDELVLDELELLLPEQGQQVVAGVGGEEPRPVDRLEEPRQLLVLGAATDRERAHAVLEQPQARLSLLLGWW